jgi:N-formylglutamate deformylase
MNEVVPGVLRLSAPDEGQLPLLFDSPHSGRTYPDDFAPSAPWPQIRRAQDSYVDELFAAAPDHAAAFLVAEFPRIYIDPNRALEDLDAELLDAPWPGPLAPSEKSVRGLGLIWRLCPPGDRPIYDRKLGVAEVRRRIDAFYRPYHGALHAALDRLHAAFGQVWHINCHSMNSVSSGMHGEGAGVTRPDFVLGDRDGSTCAPGLTAFVRAWLEDRGHSVAINDPYKGVELVRAYSDPGDGRHSLQIEVNRRLYMDERTLERGPGFERTRDLMTGLIGALGDLVRKHLT